MVSEEIKRCLESSGLRCTPQRFGVMAFLMEQTGHPTAPEIFEGVNRLDPRSSRATIYNNLRDLVQAGSGSRSGRGGAAQRDSMLAPCSITTSFCDRCGNVEDLKWYDVPRPVLRLAWEASSSRMRIDRAGALRKMRSASRGALTGNSMRIPTD